MDKNFEITWVSLWRIVGMLMLASILYAALDIWIAVLLSIVISSALDPFVSWLERKNIPRIIGSLGIFIFVILTVALILYTIVPLALSELHILLKNVNKGFSEFGDPALSLEATRIITEVNDSLGRFTNLLISGSASFVDALSKFFGGLVLTLSVFVLSFYLTIDRDGVEKLLRELSPANYEEKILEVYFRVRKKIGQWLHGQILLSLSVGLSVFLGLCLMGVKYSLVLGILAGILEIVPFVGPIVSGGLAFFIALSQSPSAGGYVFFLFLIIQQLEGNLLMPVFMRLTVSLHPALILISLLVGGRLLGFVGLIIAVPLAVTIQEIVDHWSTEKSKRKVAVFPVS